MIPRESYRMEEFARAAGLHPLPALRILPASDAMLPRPELDDLRRRAEDGDIATTLLLNLMVRVEGHPRLEGLREFAAAERFLRARDLWGSDADQLEIDPMEEGWDADEDPRDEDDPERLRDERDEAMETRGKMWAEGESW